MRVETHKIHHDKQLELPRYPVVAFMRAEIENIRILDRRTYNKLTACARRSTINTCITINPWSVLWHRYVWVKN
jgi:hypothetical protein